jgi:tetratricopeptide (TPR) repeat protein
MFSKPYLREAAPYLFTRAEALLEANRYRPAVNDLNEYEKLMPGNVNDRFYFIRYQAEVGGRLFQQAIDDINRAIEMRPDYDIYYAEKASLLVRLGLYDEALVEAKKCIEVAPDSSDGYLFLGLAQCLKGEKQEGLKNLKKARELGDSQADDLITKYAQ